MDSQRSKLYELHITKYILKHLIADPPKASQSAQQGEPLSLLVDALSYIEDAILCSEPVMPALDRNPDERGLHSNGLLEIMDSSERSDGIRMHSVQVPEGVVPDLQDINALKAASAQELFKASASILGPCLGKPIPVEPTKVFDPVRITDVDDGKEE